VRRRRPGDGHARRAPQLSDRPDLGRLERVAREVAAEWGLELGTPFGLARSSYVAPAGDDAVLKVTPPEDDEADEEPDALALWAGDGAVRLLRHDRARRALLLERARPGEDLADLPEDEATAVAVEVGLRLWRPAAAPFRAIADHVPRWLDAAEREGGAGAELIPLARGLYESLDVGSATLVHGDFHHHNLLASRRGRLAIDPKPMLGEPEFDVPSFLWNPLPCRLRLDLLERRLAAFAAAGLDEGRMRAWTVIRGAYLQPREADALRTLL
jgi:streptomycin 6-kinase